MKNNSQIPEHKIATEELIGSVASIQAHEQLKLEDAARESQLQKWSHFTRIAVALVLHVFVIIYLTFFVFLLGTTTVCYFVECSIMESIYGFFSFILIPVLITSLTIIFRFSDTISKVIESFTKTIRQ